MSRLDLIDALGAGEPSVGFRGPGVRADRVARFGEIDCADGILGRLTGADVMPVLLNAARHRGRKVKALPTSTHFG